MTGSVSIIIPASARSACRTRWGRFKQEVRGLFGLAFGAGLDKDTLDAYAVPVPGIGSRATGSGCSASAAAPTRCACCPPSFT